MHPFKVVVLTLFPELFPGALGCSVLGRARVNGLWSMEVINIKDFGIGRHKTVDDTPFGGGSGMVMRPDVLGDALDFAQRNNPYDILYMSPRGERFCQQHARELAIKDGVIIICARFEGVDERLINEYNVREVSIGDFIITGGELAAQTLVDATLRLIPGVIANATSLDEESFNEIGGNTLLEYPIYTKPREWRGRGVPEVLLSGHHANIAQWRMDQAYRLTLARRPDLLGGAKN